MTREPEAKMHVPMSYDFSGLIEALEASTAIPEGMPHDTSTILPLMLLRAKDMQKLLQRSSTPNLVVPIQ